MPMKYPCTACTKPSKSNQMSICCDICQQSTHYKCTMLTKKEFNKLGNSDESYYCRRCTNSIFPFQTLTYEELEDEFAHTSNKDNEQCFISYLFM